MSRCLTFKFFFSLTATLPRLRKYYSRDHNRTLVPHLLRHSGNATSLDDVQRSREAGGSTDHILARHVPVARVQEAERRGEASPAENLSIECGSLCLYHFDGVPCDQCT